MKRLSPPVCATALAALGLAAPGAAGQPTAPVPIPSVTVVGTAPLPGLGTPLAQVPSNVQSFGSRMLDEQRASGIAPFLELNGMSVSLENPSGNAFQPDLAFRGFVASPLLGTPQGLSVYQDGVRINEAFADVVHWDLLPQNAVASMQLLPGSNAVFGLNTLGGALAINMKDGFRDPGVNVLADVGSFGRRSIAADAGGVVHGVGLFAAADALDEDGWRDHSATRLRRFYGRAGMRQGADEGSLALTLADNSLNGTQALPVSMLANPRQAYTWPDTTRNELTFVNGSWAHTTADSVLSAIAYYRRVRTSGINSNVNGDYDPPESASQSFNVDSAGTTQAWGAALQASAKRSWGKATHQLLLGASWDGGSTSFAQSTQTASFVGDRESVGTGPWVTDTRVDTDVSYAGVWLGDTVEMEGGWSLAVSGRYNHARISTRDRTGTNPDIDGVHDYGRFNPAVGVTWQSQEGVNAFGGVSQGTRVPTPVELTCADPAAPCTLPNIFVADPPLQPVRATTYEAGVRGRIGGRGFYSAALWRTDLADDILFVGAGGGAVNAGYFRNVGDTRRQGLELRAGGAVGAWRVVASYSRLDATFRTGFEEPSPNNVTSSPDGLIAVQPGNRLPGVPRDTFRMRVDAGEEALRVGVSVLAVGWQYARGNENNADPAGRVGGYALVALDAAWQLARDLEVVARVDNLLDKRYSTSGILGSNYFRGPGGTFAPDLAGPELFVSPGTALGAWIGLRWRPGSETQP